MGGTNREKRHQQKKQKQAIKDARRRRKVKSKIKKLSMAMKKALNEARLEAEFPFEEYVFWICHGINYIVSDYGSGTWDPLFEGIYEGTMPSAADVGTAIERRYEDHIKEHGWTGVPQYAAAWASFEREQIFAWVRFIHRKLADQGVATPKEEAKKEHQPTVWAAINEVAVMVRNAADEKEAQAAVAQ